MVQQVGANRFLQISQHGTGETRGLGGKLPRGPAPGGEPRERAGEEIVTTRPRAAAIGAAQAAPRHVELVRRQPPRMERSVPPGEDRLATFQAMAPFRLQAGAVEPIQLEFQPQRRKIGRFRLGGAGEHPGQQIEQGRGFHRSDGTHFDQFRKIREVQEFIVTGVKVKIRRRDVALADVYQVAGGLFGVVHHAARKGLVRADAAPRENLDPLCDPGKLALVAGEERDQPVAVFEIPLPKDDAFRGNDFHRNTVGASRTGCRG